MSIINASGLALSGAEAALSLDHPVVGYYNKVTTATVSADSAASGYPASNLANPATHLKWVSDGDAAQYVTVNTSGFGSIDYIAVAKQNFSDDDISVSVEVNSGAGYSTLVPSFVPDNDGPLIFRFSATSDYLSIRLKLIPTSVPPEMAILYVGKLLVLPRKLYQGMTPTPYARVAKATNGRSESGQYLGRIITQEYKQFKIPLSLIEPAYYRRYVDPFVLDSSDTPFFFVWRPQSYDSETGFLWLNSDPMPVNESPHGLMSMSLDATGISSPPAVISALMDFSSLDDSEYLLLVG